jgi:hypothetical protein
LLLAGLAHSAAAQPAGACAGQTYPSTPPSETRIFPYAEVRRGLCGVAYTVFEGVNPEPMQVEILGVLPNSRGPGQDMILARLHGLKPEYTGVVAGMSGSPVYVDGKLLGALSFRIGQFSKEPIAGITPIEEMLAVRDAGARASAAPRTRVPAQTAGEAITPIETPLLLGGFSQEAIDRFGDRFRAMGLTPVAGLGSAQSGLKQPEPIVPGSAVSAILVQGDLSMAGTCTVTYVDKTNLLACGHPITQFGHIAFPMTKATVLATLPSPLNAFKIITTTETVGEFTEDRNAAILGRFGEAARMIPVQIEVTGSAGAGDRASGGKMIHFDVVDNRDLTPSLMLVSIFQSLQQTNQAAAEASYRLTGEMTISGQPPIHLAGVITPNELNSAAINSALFLNERFSRVYSNPLSQPVLTGLNLRFEPVGPNHSATLESVRLSRDEVHPGDGIEVEATLRPFRSEAIMLRIPLTIPAGTPPGDLRLVIGDGAVTDRLTLPSISSLQNQAVSLRDAVDQMNRAHRNDRLYATLLAHDAQTVFEGATMGGVPLSMANVYESHKAEEKIQLTGETAEELGSIDTGFAVSGSQVLVVRIK